MQSSNDQSVLQKLSDRHIRVAVVGNVDAGKSTLIGALATATPDNGRGSSRARVAKHRHEMVSGRTSCIGVHTVEYNEFGKVANADRNTVAGRKHKLPEVVGGGGRCVTLLDMAGHEKYLKTTIAGISGGMADYALVLVDASQPPTHMTVHHLDLCICNSIPVIIVLTKTDRCPLHVYKSSLSAVESILRSKDVGLRPREIKSHHGTMDVVKRMSTFTPIIPFSAVMSSGLDTLSRILRALPQRHRHSAKLNKPFEFLIEDIYNPRGVGTVVAGFVNRGRVRAGDTLHIGPMRDGSDLVATIKSIEVARNRVDEAWAGHAACFSLSFASEKQQKPALQRGMVAVKDGPVPTARRFVAEVYLLRGRTITIQKNRYEATLHILHMKTSARVVDIESHDDGQAHVSSDKLHQGGRATITFEFCRGTGYVRKGMRLIMRDGHARGFGVVTSVGS